MARIKPPWFFCSGWWSPWCLLDVLTRCKVGFICRRHDEVQTEEMRRDEGDWLTDPTVSAQERLARFRRLNPEVTHGPPVIVTDQPQTFSTGSGATITWRG